MYSLVSHALRNAEPMHQVLPQTLLERLFYHRHTSFLSPNSNKKDMVDIEEMASIDYMFYCTGLVAVYHILQVRIWLFFGICRVNYGWMAFSSHSTKCIALRRALSGKYL